MKFARSSRLKWPTLLLIGVIVLASFSLRTINEPPVWHEKIKLGFIGDSITAGPKQGLSAVDAEMAALKNYVAVNRAVRGTTTVDWQPGHALFDDSLAVFKTQNVRTVMIMLGTNDVRTDRNVSPATYKRNIEKIIENLLSSGVVNQVVVNYPPYVVPGSYGTWSIGSVARLKNYRLQLDDIVHERGVAQGDTRAFAYFKSHPYQLIDGVHPNANGNEALGKLWAEAFQKILADEASERQSAWLAKMFYGRT